MGTNSSGKFDQMAYYRSKTTEYLNDEVKRTEQNLRESTLPQAAAVYIKYIALLRLVIAERIGKKNV